MGTKTVRLRGPGMGFRLSIRNLDIVQAKFANIGRIQAAIIEGFKEAAEILRDAIRDEFDRGVAPPLLLPSAAAAGKTRSQTLVTTGQMRDAVVVIPVRTSSRDIAFAVGIPSGPLADRLRMHEFGPTNLPLTPARRNLLRSLGFNISDTKQFVVIPRRPVLQLAASRVSNIRMMEKAVANHIIRALKI